VRLFAGLIDDLIASGVHDPDKVSVGGFIQSDAGLAM
jgi:hypothetical protein